jgi:hypothetical protein
LFEFKLKRKFACNKHPKYNPAQQGQYGIVGGCVHCKELLVFYELTKQFMTKLAAFEECSASWGVRKKRATSAKRQNTKSETAHPANQPSTSMLF